MLRKQFDFVGFDGPGDLAKNILVDLHFRSSASATGLGHIGEEDAESDTSPTMALTEVLLVDDKDRYLYQIDKDQRFR
ncbi:hypothetical protein PanWU01x14_193680 [Parasponia andersonii]|uniref:Uncharacterized protein n=1 Tax=Parasponia andersonii TaxID=3476 RepID=A0A2P5C0Q3_PARAD|nr:hypothetical protein PanWU01x14_193680 [Parasponia andersonii]